MGFFFDIFGECFLIQNRHRLRYRRLWRRCNRFRCSFLCHARLSFACKQFVNRYAEKLRNFDTVRLLIFNSFASSVCDKPAFFLISAINLPILALSIYLTSHCRCFVIQIISYRRQNCKARTAETFHSAWIFIECRRFCLDFLLGGFRHCRCCRRTQNCHKCSGAP